MKRWICALLCCLILFTTGCQGIRLLEFKHQIKRFHKFFTLNPKALRFKSPILKTEDILLLTRLKPRNIFENSNSHISRWKYHYQKQAAIEEKDSNKHDLNLIFEFKNKKLETLYFPKPITKLFNGKLFRRALETIGNGQYNQNAHSFKSGSSQNKTVFFKTDLPHFSEIQNVLGPPSSIQHYPNQIFYLYIYDLEGTKDDILHKEISWLEFRFDKSNMDLKVVRTTLLGPLLHFNLPNY